MIPYSNYFVENYHTYYEDIADRNLKSLRLITTLGFLMGVPEINGSVYYYYRSFRFSEYPGENIPEGA